MEPSDNITAMLVSCGSGVLLKIMEPTWLNWDYPPIILHTIQIVAWAITITTGTIAIYKWFKKRKVK